MKYLEFNTPATKQAGDLASDYRPVEEPRTDTPRPRVLEPAVPAALVEEAIFRNEGHLVRGGPFVVNTGKWSARAAADKFVVQEHRPRTRSGGASTTAPSAETSRRSTSVLSRLQAFLQGEELFVQDCFVGADARIPHADPRHHRPRRGTATSPATCS